MTEFEQIRQELVTLGWSCCQARGDHFKFTKEGRRSIILSMSMPGGRARQNALAEIRRAEPDFQLGRNTVSKEAEKSRKVTDGVLGMTDEQRAYAKRKGFIAVGQSVRYVSAEGRDYSKLSDPLSLMNMQYKVKEILSDSGHAFISSPDDLIALQCDNHEITLGPEDLETWETAACKECGKTFPVSELVGNGDLCGECSRERRRLIRETLDNLPVDDVDGMIRITNLEKKYRDMLKPYRGKKLSDLPEDLLLPFVRNAADLLQKKKEELEARIRNHGKDVPEAKTNENIYSRWKRYVDTCRMAFEMKAKKSGYDGKDRKSVSNEIILSSYAEEELKGWKVFSVRSTAAAFPEVYTNLQFFYDDLRKYYGKDTVLIKYTVKEEGFCQWMPDQSRPCRQKEFLEKALDEKTYKEQCSMVRAVASLPGLDVLEKHGRNLLSLLVDKGIISRQDADGFSVSPQYFYGSAEKVSDIPGTVPTAQIYLCSEDSEMMSNLMDDTEFLGGLLEEAGIDRYTEVLLQENGDGNPINFKVVSVNEDDLEERPYEDPLDEVEVTCCFPRTLYNKFRARAAEMSLTGEQVMQKLIDIFVESKGDINNMKINKKEDMENNKTTTGCVTLDSGNPASENEALRGLTTRELLRELKARGVTFEKVSVPVVTVQEVDINEI